MRRRLAVGRAYRLGHGHYYFRHRTDRQSHLLVCSDAGICRHPCAFPNGPRSQPLNILPFPQNIV